MKPNIQKSDKGILKAEAGFQKFSLMRYEPAPALSLFVEHYWVVRWDLTGQAPYRQVILSYPNINLSFERENNHIFSGVYGVPKTTFARHLQGEGIVLGVKFRPGGFYPFWKQPASLLTGQILGIRDVFGIDAKDVEEQIFAQGNGETMALLAEQFLLERLPEPDENVDLINCIVQAAIDNREFTKVEDIVSEFGINKRTLQRLFSRYVGVSPKWVIQRYRLQEAAELMEKGGVPDWPKLSQDLGYYDQAHFIKNFKAMIGKSPEEYVKGLGI
ncbi:helix-turn-helix transcriptional regulator [Paenibacillus sedimenti]|uniref:Helix-turn-helix transcriptional regulator n=1 Tax=Paenibacillus sedimenti TaxID=2770274 RepID=A0A926KQB9_9BACL|nr:helix-turn-helix transcriptional regulator [Paenibacillus sedimenti]MBD0381975.1 helix-turn-helix transcriptional regulator [Paenibacillus sedimenti]